MPLLELSFVSGERSLSVRRFVVQEAISSLFRVSVWARSSDPSVDLSGLVGQAAGLRIESGYKFVHQPGRLWSGICACAAQVEAESAPRLSTYQIEIVPVMWLLTKRRGHRIFQHLSIPDIVAAILAEWRVEPIWEIDRDRYPKLEIKIQYGESDFTFVCRLLEEAGIAFLFEDTDDDSQLIFRDEPQTKAMRGDPLPCVEHANQAAEMEFVSSVHLGREVRPGALVLRDYDFRRPAFPLAEEVPKAEPPEDRNEQILYAPGSYLAELGAGGGTPVADDKGVARYDVGYGKAKATRLLDGARVGKQSVTFDTNALDLRPGTVFSVSNHAHPDVAGRPLLATSFSLDGSPTDTWRQSGRAVSAEVRYRPPAVTPKPAVHGLQSATVVGARTAHEIQEIHVDELGRVRVQFPWDRDGNADDRASCWIRVSQGWAGKAYGVIAIPRVGQEVLVTFLDGDPDQPVITGRLFNALNPVSYKLPDDQTISTWKSHASPGSNGYNEIKLEDRKGQELFYQQAEKNQRVLIKHDETITVLHNRRKDVTEDETDTTGVHRTEVTVMDRAEATAIHRTTWVGGDRGEWVKGDRGVRVEGHRQTLLGKTQDLVVKGQKRERVQRDAHSHVKGDRREQVDDDRSFIVVEDSHEKIGASAALAAGKSASYHAGEKLVGEGGLEMTAKGPGGFVSIGSTGITIHGVVVRINAGGSPGDSRPAKPARPLLARELKQPKPTDAVEDARADQDVSGLAKHLAAVAALAKVKPSAGGKKWRKSVVFQGTKVFQRDDLIRLDARDKSGRTNLQRMKKGLAPHGLEGKPINLHHMIQSDKGSIAEVSDLFHKKYDRILHINPKTTPSGIDRKKFRAWKRRYWLQRAADMEKGEGAS